MKYERVPDYPINFLKFDECAFDVAHQHYKKMKGISFLRDLLDYHRHGFIVSRPNLFAMARPIERNGKRGWLIRYSTGNLLELLGHLPCRLDFIAFCRNNDGKLRFVNWDAFWKTVVKMGRHQIERQG